ncbi:MAG TPA: GNVR domain-containing protein [Thermoanaerobaculia bacterium]|nr:GNVR domain-containing protein [Thermoanaerobaculia bacterium]
MKNLTLSELFKSLWRRPVWFLTPVVLGVVGAYVALQFMPTVYRATTQVLVEAQKVPADYVKPTVTSSIEERVRTIQPQVENHDNLARIIRELDLYPELRQSWPLERVIEKVRNDLDVRPRGDVFEISFQNPDRVKAAKTANRVAELFIASNLELRENQAKGTSTFLEAELAATKRRLEGQEARIAAFKRLYMGQLPEQRDTNLRSVEALQTKLEINMDALNGAETRKLLLQRQAAELRAADPLDPPPIVGGLRAPAAPPAPSRLDQLRTELIELRSRYTDRHPDVIRLEEQIARLEVLERERLEREAAAAEADVEVSEAAPLPRRKTPRMDPVLRAELDAVELEIRGLRAERQRILADIGQYQARLENVPRVEQELLSLTRDYDNIQRQYESLLDKQLNARLYQNLEKSQQGERFTILERARPPILPFKPKPLIVLGLGLAVGLLFGTVLALLREQTDPTYVDPESLQEAFPGVPLLATIPVFSGAGAGARRS